MLLVGGRVEVIRILLNTHIHHSLCIMPINIYPNVLGETLDSDAFDPDIDKYCQEIYEGCKGRGANVPQVIAALAKDGVTRHYIQFRYKELYDKDLAQVMRKEFRW